jgi:hypothetical protein
MEEMEALEEELVIMVVLEELLQRVKEMTEEMLTIIQVPEVEALVRLVVPIQLMMVVMVE